MSDKIAEIMEKVIESREKERTTRICFEACSRDSYREGEYAKKETQIKEKAGT